jgi:prepilin-type N-terminal cleavage/methylation domain-containing protein
MWSHSKGFTLMELLVVLTIVSLLATAAIPAYRRYRSHAYDFRALSDLQIVAVAEESYYLENERYLSCSGNSCLKLPSVPRLSNGVKLDISASEDSFVGNASHPKGTGKVYKWDSSKGGIVD